MVIRFSSVWLVKISKSMRATPPSAASTICWKFWLWFNLRK